MSRIDPSNPYAVLVLEDEGGAGDGPVVEDDGDWARYVVPVRRLAVASVVAGAILLAIDRVAPVVQWGSFRIQGYEPALVLVLIFGTVVLQILTALLRRPGESFVKGLAAEAVSCAAGERVEEAASRVGERSAACGLGHVIEADPADGASVVVRVARARAPFLHPLFKNRLEGEIRVSPGREGAEVKGRVVLQETMIADTGELPGLTALSRYLVGECPALRLGRPITAYVDVGVRLAAATVFIELLAPVIGIAWSSRLTWVAATATGISCAIGAVQTLARPRWYSGQLEALLGCLAAVMAGAALWW